MLVLFRWLEFEFCGLFWGDDSNSPIRNKTVFHETPVTYFIFPQDLKSQQEKTYNQMFFQIFFGKSNAKSCNMFFYLVVSTHLKHMIIKIGSFSPSKGEHEKILEEENGNPPLTTFLCATARFQDT